MKILLLLDMNNLWNACCEQYGKRARVNIEKVVERAKGRKNDTVTGAAFVAIKPDKNQENLVRKLNELGFMVITANASDGAVDFSQAMLDVVRPMLEEIDTLVLASGDPSLLPVIELANQSNKTSHLLAFCNGMSSLLAKEADEIELLDKRDIVL